jgi:soluble lytic murein transglycosylase-like protein
VTVPRFHGLLGAAIAVGVFAVLIAFPAALQDGARRMEPAERSPRASLAPRWEPSSAEARVDSALARRMGRLGAPERLALARTIVAEASAARIDPLLVLALIHVESSFDPRALSGAGARGLMQLREPTLRRELERAGLPQVDPHDPVMNVLAGVRYLRRLLDAFGREEVALMAYNAGPNRILGYLREGEIPERFHAYPRRIKAEHRKLRRTLGVDAGLASARTPSAPE